MFLQGLAFFYRSLLEYLEGPGSENRYKDLDPTLDDPVPDRGSDATPARVT